VGIVAGFTGVVRTRLAIDFTAVADLDDENGNNALFDDVEDAVTTLADAAFVAALNGVG
jgi:hypothetical protein